MGSFVIPSGDYVNAMFLMIFGPIWTAIVNSGLNFGAVGSAGGGVFGPAFMVYNLAIMGLTLFYIVKIVLEGVVGTAYHGEWLGKSFHGFFTPMRVIIMLALIAPVSSGFSISQIIVLWTAGQAIAVADGISNTMLISILKTGLVFNPQIMPSSRQVASSLLQDLVCVDTYNSGASGGPALMTSSSTGSGTTHGVEFGGRPGTNISPSACGTIIVSSASQPKSSAEINGINAMMPILNPVALKITNGALGQPTQNTSTGSVLSGSTSGIPSNAVSLAAQAYSEAVQSAVASQVTAANSGLTNSWSTALQNDGFGALGSFQIQVSSLDQKIADFSAAQPDITGPATADLPAGYGYQQTSAAAMSYIENDNQLAATPGSLAGQITNPLGNLKSGSLMARIIDPVLIRLNGSILSDVKSLSSSTSNPIGALQTLGITLMVSGLTAYSILLLGVGSLGAATGNLVGNAAGAGKAASFVIGFIKPVALMLIAGPILAGGILAYVIPAMLYIMYTFAVIGWVAAVFVGVVGAPLWAASHAVPDGEGFVPAGASQGYKLLLSIFAKPALIVFGFFAAMLLFSAGEYLINKTFIFVANGVLQSSMGGSVAQGVAGALMSLIGTLIYVGILVVVYWKLGEWSFGLVNLVPDRALDWIGLNDISMSEEGVHGEVYGGVVSHTRTVQGAVVQPLPERAGGGGNGNESGETGSNATPAAKTLETDVLPERNT
ncbi:DotA/TraY family protein [Acidiphilium acidophilum]|uniref:DotA/TraY family protein n=1 Tax=Acidiphilium acidophilum TaxID=76588 RepID=A0AAW9DTV9_ACIAO|nr:DotA/TraY family protein [Acidiphilium acidophilum]MDX5931747.1 DotA/TraY family protein [Acidiphilium acidophilum]